VGIWQSFALEVLLTGFLMLAVMAVVTGSDENRRFSGIVIGGVVALEAMWAGPLTGASMNPARSLGPALVSGELGSLWIYLAAPLIGALVAAVAYQDLLGRGLTPGVTALPTPKVGATQPAATLGGGSPTRS